MAIGIDTQHQAVTIFCINPLFRRRLPNDFTSGLAFDGELASKSKKPPIIVVSASFITYLLEQGLMIVKKWDPSEGETERRRHYP